ncbi:MAG: hypothetical protein EOP39_04550 [Rubrivivax sp.]|nr:MAG: hypothetical protein EOP39_04550 [Rubrivivax sp.]
MAAKVNEALLDEAVHHAVDLHAYSNGVVRRLIAILNRTDARLFAQLQTVLETMDPASFTVQRLELLLQSVRGLNAEVYRQFEAAMLADLQGLASVEATYNVDLFRTVLPPQISVASITQEQVYAAALSRPMQGRLLKEWASSLEVDRATRIRDTLRMGFVEGKTTDQLIRELRGTRAKGYSDGIIEIDRRNAASVVRTAVSHTAGSARDQFNRANADLIKAEVWRATLDSRTSAPCRLRDGKQYTPGEHKPIGHKIPWLSGPGRLHWQCRSCSSVVTKSWKELGGADLPEFTPSQRASMDGAVPADLDYGSWLKKQSAARQDEVLGSTRGKLMRDGGLTLDKFSSEKGVWFDLATLKERNAAAFKRAGLN